MQPLHRQFRSEYNAWVAMRQRCQNPANQSWQHYGGRGIKVCPRWMASFRNFLNDMGPKPHRKLWLARQDVNGDYEPTNCRWTAPKYPAGNRRFCHKANWRGENLNIVEIARREAIYPNTFRHRLLQQGMDVEQALSRPMTRRGGQTPLSFNGRTQSLARWAREIGISPVTLQARLFRYGIELERALTATDLRRPPLRAPSPS